MTTTQSGIVRSMRKIGTYRAEYLPTIRRLAAMRDQYSALQDQYAAMDPAILADFHKPAIVSVMESLRRDILSYERDLGLTPAALKRLDQQEHRTESSPLADALRLLDGSGSA